MNLILRSFRVCCVGAICVLSASTSTAEVTEYSAGHADIGLAITGGDLILRYQFYEGSVLDGVPETSSTNVEPDDAYVRVADSAKVSTTAPAPFLGTTAGDDIWVLPQTGSVATARGLPFLGLNAEALRDNDPAVDSVTLALTGFNGPGAFAMWQDRFPGGPNVLMQTVDGINSDDSIEFGVGFHDHINYGFTQEGIYDVELTATASFFGGGSVEDVETFKFLVGSATAIPEPGSLAVLASGSVGLLVRRRRKLSRRTAHFSKRELASKNTSCERT